MICKTCGNNKTIPVGKYQGLGGLEDCRDCRGTGVQEPIPSEVAVDVQGADLPSQYAPAIEHLSGANISQEQRAALDRAVQEADTDLERMLWASAPAVEHLAGCDGVTRRPGETDDELRKRALRQMAKAWSWKVEFRR